MRRSSRSSTDGTYDLFDLEPESYIGFGLAKLSWPDQRRFPVNVAPHHVGDVVETDLTQSNDPLLVAGYSSIAKLIRMVSVWRHARGDQPGTVRLLLGTEPFPSQRTQFGSPQEEFTDEVRRYWLERSVSVRLSAKVIRALEELRNGVLQVRVIPGSPSLHAKIYVGDAAATVGSSNYTDFGMTTQVEANARFEATQEKTRYAELQTVANNLWSKGVDWADEFRRLLEDLLQVVPWQEALARACAELLEGDWVESRLPETSLAKLWPSQAAGIAQALWVVENLGSVLVADATGSGKTRMGAHLVAAVRHRLLDTGRMRRDRDLTTLVCPPAVRETWQQEALVSGVTIMPVSHGLLSRSDPAGPRDEETAVARAQVLAVDEAHNFLTIESNRTRHIRETVADHVLLFTATPISRGAQDLLALVGLLGADNFDDATLDVLDRLERGLGSAALSDEQRTRLRQEIQSFTVRRTKSMLNDLVSQNEDAYRHPETGRVCRFPSHGPKVYATGETAADEQAAEEIRTVAEGLLGIVALGRRIWVPPSRRDDVTDEAWLNGRLTAAHGLTRHHVLASMRSSRAALAEHIAGTAAAADAYEISTVPKAQATGNVVATVRRLAKEGLPKVELSCDVPDWLTDSSAWHAACEAEAAAYERILEVGSRLSPAREQAKAALLTQLAERHRLILAFDHRPITLAVLGQELHEGVTEVVVATGQALSARKHVRQLFARDSSGRAIALCSDAMNEGLNLQGAAALVHLDLPTTLRVAEQRVGRVDRMDSPHDRIEVWWPDDGPSFATREVELLVTRRHASEELLGSNLPLPVFSRRPDDTVVSVDEHIRALDSPGATWDGIQDALEPVRRLVWGAEALVPRAVYDAHRHTRHRVMARVAPVASSVPWAFLALSGTRHGAPRWLLLEGESPEATIGVEAVSERLRMRLSDNPPNVEFDQNCERWLDRYLTAAAGNEALLLPRRMQRALGQMVEMTTLWSENLMREGQMEAGQQWRRVARIAQPGPEDEERLDPYLVAEVWWDLVRPLFAELPRTRRQRRYVRLRDLDHLLRTRPLDLSATQDALRRVPVVEPVDKRVSAVILGVPTTEVDVGDLRRDLSSPS